MINLINYLINLVMAPLKRYNSSDVKREFGKYFERAMQGEPVIIENKMTNKEAVLIDLDEYLDMLEIIEEMKDEDLNHQIESSYKEFKAGKAKEGLEGLIDLMNAKKKRALLSH